MIHHGLCFLSQRTIEFSLLRMNNHYIDITKKKEKEKDINTYSIVRIRRSYKDNRCLNILDMIKKRLSFNINK